MHWPCAFQLCCGPWQAVVVVAARVRASTATGSRLLTIYMHEHVCMRRSGLACRPGGGGVAACGGACPPMVHPARPLGLMQTGMPPTSRSRAVP